MPDHCAKRRAVETLYEGIISIRQSLPEFQEECCIYFGADHGDTQAPRATLAPLRYSFSSL